MFQRFGMLRGLLSVILLVALTGAASAALTPVTLAPCDQQRSNSISGLKREVRLETDPSNPDRISITAEFCGRQRESVLFLERVQVYFARDGSMEKVFMDEDLRLCLPNTTPSCRDQTSARNANNLYCITQSGSLVTNARIRGIIAAGSFATGAVVKRPGNTDEAHLCAL